MWVLKPFRALLLDSLEQSKKVILFSLYRRKINIESNNQEMKTVACALVPMISFFTQTFRTIFPEQKRIQRIFYNKLLDFISKKKL